MSYSIQLPVNVEESDIQNIVDRASLRQGVSVDLIDLDAHEVTMGATLTAPAYTLSFKDIADGLRDILPEACCISTVLTEGVSYLCPEDAARALDKAQNWAA